MGHGDKKYFKTIKQMTRNRLKSMLAAGAGTSKKEAIADGTARDKIFSYSTYHTYLKHCNYFCDWLKARYPEVTSWKKAKKHVNEWLRERCDYTNSKGEHLSAWTIQLEVSALSKLFGIEPDDPHYFHAPERHRYDIKRSRLPAARDRNFSESNNFEFIQFCKGTGLRRGVMEELQGKDLYTREDLEKLKKEMEGSDDGDARKHLTVVKQALQTFPDYDYFIHSRHDKGGKERFSPIIGKDAAKIIARMQDTGPDERVWYHVPANADIHSYRADYATSLYKHYARNIQDIPYDKVNQGSGKKYQSQVYICRGDEKGKRLDKVAMRKASIALGHNRIDVIATNYLRGL